jgi:hypothetical protein
MTHQTVAGSDAAVPADFVRLSCGVEAPEDLVDDLRLAFERAAAGGRTGVSGAGGAADAGAQRSAAGQAMR